MCRQFHYNSLSQGPCRQRLVFQTGDSRDHYLDTQCFIAKQLFYIIKTDANESPSQWKLGAKYFYFSCTTQADFKKLSLGKKVSGPAESGSSRPPDWPDRN